MHKNNILKGYSLAVLAVFFWSFNVIVSKYLVNTMTPWQIAFFRWFFAMVALLPFTAKGIIKYRKIIYKNSILILFMSIFGIVLSNTFIYIAGHTISAIDMSLINVSGPIFLVVLSAIFLKQKMKKEQAYGLLITILGIIIVVARGSIVNLENFELKIGDFWTLMAALTFGSYGTLMLKKPKELPEIVLLSVIITTAVIIILPIFISSLKYNNLSTLPKTTWALMVYMGVVNSLLAYLCWNTALNKFGSVKISVIYYLMPIFSMIESYFLLGEKILLSQIYGGFLVLLGILIIEFYGNYKIKIERA